MKPILPASPLEPTNPDPGARPLEPVPPDPGITAELLWSTHRAALGGKSSVSGAELPHELAQCPPGAQGAHWAMALAARLAANPHAHEPPLPAGVSAEEAERIRGVVREELARRAGK